MNRITRYLALLFWPLLLVGCDQLWVGEQPADDPRAVFETLWTEIEGKYSYLDYKNLDWNRVYQTYSPMIRPGMNELELFRVLEAMMNELQDGHANLFTPFTYSAYRPLFLSRPTNFDARLVLERYFLRDSLSFFTTGPIQHAILDTLGKRIGLMAYRDFTQSPSEAQLDFVMDRMRTCDGVILDVRANGGGLLTNARRLSGRFTNEGRKSHYHRMKTGRGADDFSRLESVFTEPTGEEEHRYTGPVVLLQNRGSYSATSFLAMHMRALPQVRLLGDTTGGGLGIPHGASLPNGWNYRFSVGQALSAELDSNGAYWNWENGVPPHTAVDLDPAQASQGFDSMIERAIVDLLSR